MKLEARIFCLLSVYILHDFVNNWLTIYIVLHNISKTIIIFIFCLLHSIYHYVGISSIHTCNLECTALHRTLYLIYFQFSGFDLQHRSNLRTWFLAETLEQVSEIADVPLLLLQKLEGGVIQVKITSFRMCLYILANS